MMNTLYRSLIIFILIMSTFISGINLVDLDNGFSLFDKIRRPR
jgi:hypothetical protein